jgi:hypothetical protein
LAEREDHVCNGVLLDHGVVVDTVAYDLLVLKERHIVHAFDHVDAKAGEEEDLKEVEELHEHKRGHAVVLVVLVDAGEELVQVVDVAPLGFKGVFLDYIILFCLSCEEKKKELTFVICLAGQGGELGREVLVLVVRGHVNALVGALASRERMTAHLRISFLSFFCCAFLFFFFNFFNFRSCLFVQI